MTSSTRLIVGTRYWTKLQFTGSQYILSLSTDGKNFVTQSTINNTAKVSQINNFAFGCDRNTATLGNTASIDLPNCYIKVNNKEVWRGGTGILTLKAGSKVYVPNGKNADGSLKFDEYITSNDIEDNDFRNASREVAFLITKTENDMISVWPNTTVVSGTSTPDFSGTGYWGVWYDTENNIIKIQEGSNEWKTSYGFSLPFCLVSSSSSAVTSIDQIFDWCGFIGSTAFVLPGVKGLIPNGFNADGTYKSIEFTTDTVLTVTRTWDVSASFIQKLFLYNRGKGLGIQNYQTESNSMPTANDWTVWYNSKENVQRWNNSSNTLTDISQWTVDTTMRYIGEIPSDGTSKITSLTAATIKPLQSGMPITKVYTGSVLVYEKLLPVGTVLYENSTAGTETIYTIPDGVKCILFDIRGGCGYGGSLGGRVTGYIRVTPGMVFNFVTAYTKTDRITPQYNASDIRIPALDTSNWYNQRIATAGGGGSHSSRGAAGGIGGYTATQGRPGYRGDAGGYPGTQTADGAGGVGQPVSIGHYHNGAAGSSTYPKHGGAGISCGYCGQTGAGGAGWFAGGSGAGDWNKNGGYAAGGGGGSSGVNSDYVINPVYEDGVSAAGYVKITVAKI